jgi:hypothetical protein
MIKTDSPIPGLGESISLNGRRNDATLRMGGRSYHRDIVDLPRRSRRNETIRRGLRNPFLKRPYFIGGSVFFFAGGSAPVTLLRTRPADNFEASRESDNNPSFHFTE